MSPPLGPGTLSDDARLTSVCLAVAYVVNIHGAHSYWKQGALGAAGVGRVWAGAGPQRAAYRGGILWALPPTACSYLVDVSVSVRDRHLIKVSHRDLTSTK